MKMDSFQEVVSIGNIAEAAADDDNYDGIGNNFYAGYCYYRAAKEGRKEEKNK